MSSSLDPKNGDFVQYLKDLESGKVRNLQGLHIQLPSETDTGMLTVTRQEPPKPKPTREPAPVGMTQARVLLGISNIVLALGIALFALCIIDEALMDMTPLAMFMLFGGFVGNAESRKRIKRLTRQVQHEPHVP